MQFGVFVNSFCGDLAILGGYFVILTADTPLDMLFNALAFSFIKDVDNLLASAAAKSFVARELKSRWNVDRDAVPTGTTCLCPRYRVNSQTVKLIRCIDGHGGLVP